MPTKLLLQSQPNNFVPTDHNRRKKEIITANSMLTIHWIYIVFCWFKTFIFYNSDYFFNLLPATELQSVPHIRPTAIDGKDECFHCCWKCRFVFVVYFFVLYYSIKICATCFLLFSCTLLFYFIFFKWKQRWAPDKEGVSSRAVPIKHGNWSKIFK